MRLFEKIKKMNKNQMYKAIALPLIFVLACASIFMGSQSFSKYVEEQKGNGQATLTAPNIHYHRGRLTRTSIDNEFYDYPIKKDETDTLIFEDLRPSDVIEYIFYISNYDNDDKVNEIPSEVTIEIIVSLERMKTNDVKNGISYYVVGANLDAEMPKASFNIGKQLDKGTPTSISYNSSDYVRMDRKAYLTGTDGDYTGENFFKDNELYVDARKVEIVHRIGLQIPADGKRANKAYLLRIALPEQDDEFETYIAGRLHIDVNIIINQVEEKQF